MLAQSIIDESWVKMIVQLGVAGLWLWWLTKHLKDQTDRDDKASPREYHPRQTTTPSLWNGLC